MSIHPKSLLLFGKHFVLSKVKTDIEIKIENGRLIGLLGCVGLNWR
jgi:ABC-type uncharacterized transport system ATPase subunit